MVSNRSGLHGLHERIHRRQIAFGDQPELGRQLRAPDPRLLRHQLFSPIPPPSWLLEGISAGLEIVVLNATRKDPDNRYGSMAEVLADLKRLQAGREIELRSLLHQPDGYEATTDQGRKAAEVLARRFGSYARVQEPRSRTRQRTDDG